MKWPEGLEELKNRVITAVSEDRQTDIDESDLRYMAEWMLELEDRIQELERK